MATEISLDLINQLKVSLRREAKLSSYDSVTDSSLPTLPTAPEAIAEIDASVPYLRCRNCRGKLLRGIESLICVFCGKEQRTSENPPDPIKFTSTSAYKLFLSSLNLDGSEMVEPLKETDGSSRGAKAPVIEGIPVSKFLDLEVQWSAREEKTLNNGQSVENKNPLNLGGISIDDYFVEERGDLSKVDPKESKQEDDDFKDPRSLSLFDSVKSQGVSDSQRKENVGLFIGKDAQKNVSSGEHENLSLFAGRDAQDGVSLAEQGNFGFFEGKDSEHPLKEEGNLSLFEGKEAQRTSSSKNDESFDFFEGRDAQRTSSSKVDETFGLFEGNDAQRNSSSKDDESFDFFEGKEAQRTSSSKDDESFGSFQGKDAQRTSYSKDDQSFGFFEGKDAQRTSSSKNDESFGLFEGKDAQRTSSSKDDESLGSFQGKDTQRNSSSKVDESFSLFEGKDAQRNSASREDGDLGLFEGKDGQKNSTSKEDGTFGFFEGAPSSNAGLKSFDDKVVASSSDWDSDFQSVSQQKTRGDPFVNSPVDLAAHMDSIFGSGKDLLFDKTADSSTAYVPKAGDWLQDDFFGNVTGTTQNNDPAVHDKNEGQVVGGNGSSSMDIDWIGDDLWQTSEKKAIEKTPTDDNDNDDDDDWNDFASSVNSKTPSSLLSRTMESSQEEIFDGLSHVKNNFKEQSKDDKQNTDIAKGQEGDLFGTWNSFTSSTILQTPVQPPRNHVNPSAEHNREMNLFGENNHHRDLDSDFFAESIGNQTHSEEVKAMPSETSTLERTSDPDGKEKTLDLVGATTISRKSKSDIAEELMSQMHDLSFMLETKLSVPPISKAE